MKNALLLIIFAVGLCLTSISQTDTIVSNNGKKVIGAITLVNDNNIFYKDKKGFGGYIKLSEVSYYTQLGRRVVPPLINLEAITIQKDSPYTQKTEDLNESQTAGENLIFASEIMFTSFVIVVAGALLVGVSTLIAAPMLAIIGGVAIIGGEIYSITAWKKIKRAGKYLKKNKL